MTALDAFCGFKQESINGKTVVTEAGISAMRLTTDFARRFVKHRPDEGTATPQTIGLSALRRMLTFAKRDKKIHDTPYIEFQKEPPARDRFLERSDFDRLVKALPTHFKPLVTFLYWCGCAALGRHFRLNGDE